MFFNVCKNMKLSNIDKVFSLITFIVFLTVSNKIEAQSFNEARDFAFTGEREKARSICRQILKQEFNTDAALLLGRTYAWDAKYDSARIVFNEVIIQSPDNMEVLDASADVEYWSENYSKALEYCDLALQKDSTAEEFVLKKAKILNGAEREEEAVSTLKNFIGNNPGHTEAMIKLKEYRLDALKNNIKISYTLDVFEKGFHRDPWHLVALSYGRKTKLGRIETRINYASRFLDNGFQYELDAYPKLGKKDYLYFNYGFSDNTLFPKNRFGLEWYHSFPKAFEGSVGMRMLYFENSTVDIYTATLGKYLGNFWMSLRSFVTPGSDETSVSGSLQVRHYFSDPENYLGLRMGYGISPDDNRNLFNSGRVFTKKAKYVRLEYNHIFSRLWILKLGSTLGKEERLPEEFVGYYTFDITLSRLF
jgi:YaiO family outer membrane protein